MIQHRCVKTFQGRKEWPKKMDAFHEKFFELQNVFYTDSRFVLIGSNSHVLKFFLHISREKQKQRIKERLTQPHK